MSKQYNSFWPFPVFPNPLDKPGKPKFNPDNCEDAPFLFT